MPIQPQNTAKQFGAETVHHRHHDNQRCNTKHDAKQRKDGDDGNKAFLPTWTQVAKGHHTFERTEHGQSILVEAGQEKGMNKEDVVNRSKAVGEPPLMLAISAFTALKNAVNNKALKAPANPENILMAIKK